MHRVILRLFLPIFTALGSCAHIDTQPELAWIPAFVASPQQVWTDTSLFETNLPTTLSGTVLRQPFTVGYGGTRIKIRLSNTFGINTLPIEAGVLARDARNGRIMGDAVPLSFSGNASIRLRPGETVLSDPMEFSVQSGTRLSLTVRFGEAAMAQDFHWDARVTSYVLEDESITVTDPEVLETISARVSLSAALVENTADAVVIAMGDSITDGATASMDAESRWPDFLARRVADNGIAVVNAGISGNRLLTNGMGESVLDRLARDGLDESEASTLLLLIGTNDIAWPGSALAPNEPPMSLQSLKLGYKQVAEQVHSRKHRIIFGTLPPFKGALPGTPMEGNYWSKEKEAMRRAINDWLRSADWHDGIVDFDKALADPTDPERIAKPFDSGDHLHPGDAGNKAMADAVSLDILKGNTP